jgi:serine/threonine protein phosphatase PrpC
VLTQVFRLEKGDDFVVLASDGVWNVLSNAAVLDKVATTVKHVDFGPQRLVGEAYEGGSDDNITAIVVYLKPPPDIGVAARS